MFTTQSQISFHHHMFDPFYYLPPPPFPAGRQHIVVCAYEFLFVCFICYFQFCIKNAKKRKSNFTEKKPSKLYFNQMLTGMAIDTTKWDARKIQHHFSDIPVKMHDSSREEASDKYYIYMVEHSITYLMCSF